MAAARFIVAKMRASPDKPKLGGVATQTPGVPVQRLQRIRAQVCTCWGAAHAPLQAQTFSRLRPHCL